MDDLWSYGRLEMEPYNRPSTTIIWFSFREEVDPKALDEAFSQISQIPSWETTLIASTEPSSNQRVAFISKLPFYSLDLCQCLLIQRALS